MIALTATTSLIPLADSELSKQLPVAIAMLISVVLVCGLFWKAINHLIDKFLDRLKERDAQIYKATADFTEAVSGMSELMGSTKEALSTNTAALSDVSDGYRRFERFLEDLDARGRRVS